MRTVLHILTRPEDELTREVIAKQRMLADTKVEVVELTGGEPDYGALIEAMGYVSFYLLTTAIAVPGVVLFWFMIRSGLADLSIGSAGKETGG